MKGIVLAGGGGSRLHPLTLATSKQLLPVYDKPMIYYPLSVLMQAGITDILVISTPDALPSMRALLGDGSHLGISLSYAEQTEPRGIADAFLVGADHVAGSPTVLILGDNIFHGPGLPAALAAARDNEKGCTLFGYRVEDPERFAVAGTDGNGKLVSLEEKPERPISDIAVTGLYFYDSDVVDIAKRVRPSGRGELEITDVNRIYLEEKDADLVVLGRGCSWLDAGTTESLNEAVQYVRALESRQRIRISCLEEIAFSMGLITAEECYELGYEMRNSDYGKYVMSIARPNH
ncbi:glucose-1-phosphate thymidylyltransferase RfbA [Nocardiopsis terrae]|nr:glucose-1-phosphate thymidylyltransferase RfbA [Nocardiopsis terrae]